ncbi:unnamed protein product [Lactuca saligna]|uniref:Fe2OG dioxygenase domain-containing protein n=1 Tax=Lactuca saligna TaxID=75948 RepID=A0AA35YSE0_LACSI|nr:unnamed protein product [Lactuca saligna]
MKEHGEIEIEISECSFISAMTLTLKSDENIPEKYILPPLQRPNPRLMDYPSTNLPLIDLSLLQDPLFRSETINQIHTACNKLGFFQVVNHGIPILVMQDALDIAKEFFHLPSKEKMQFASANVREPVRYGTSMNHGTDKMFYWRDFIKHYANPISEWIQLWPSNPPTYREKMGSYAEAVNILQKQLMAIVLENLGLNANYMHDEIEEGSQAMTVNCYPPCPKPDLTLGIPPHSDYGTLTILNQNQQGLQIMDKERKWHSVPFIQGALTVQLGDQIEVMSNGRYKSTFHRATVNNKRNRLSIASLHSLPIDKKVGPAPWLVDEQYPIAYREGSFGEFLDHISKKCLSETRYIDTLRIL